MTNTTQPILTAHSLSKVWQEIGQPIQVLNQLNLTIEAGETVGILGVSGSGKSTLLHLLGGLECADQGEVRILGQSWNQMAEYQKALWRNRYVGFVYQMHHLLPELSAIENVTLPLMIASSSAVDSSDASQVLKPEDIKALGMVWLERVGLADRAQHRPAELSGGERQRVSIARALVMQPKVILADEPTGNLDRSTAHQMIDLFLSLRQQSGSAVVLVTHDLEIAGRLDRCVRLSDGFLTAFNPTL
jgi:lipoprotein-releasing system ATP-binding protein